MQDIIYAKYSCDRKDEFKIRTDILKDRHGNKTVRKKALTKKAVLHIERILNNYLALKEMNKNPKIRINKCRQIGDQIEFAFIEGKTFEEILDQKMESGKIEEVVADIKHFCDVIRSFSKKGFTKTPEFERVFGQIAVDSDQVYSVSVADVDLLFENIIVNEYWNLIDYEWTFLFDIPVDFIIYRAVCGYVYGMQEESARDTLKSLDIFQLIGIADHLDLYQKMNENFSIYVIGDALTYKELLSLHGQPAFDVKNGMQQFMQLLQRQAVQVFFDMGTGFTEKESMFIMPNWINGDEVELDVAIPGNCMSVRIDPSSGYGFFEIIDLNIDGIQVKYAANGVNLTNQLIAFYNEDPQIIIHDIKGYMQILHLKGRMQFADQDIMEGLHKFLKHKSLEIDTINHKLQIQIQEDQNRFDSLQKQLLESDEQNQVMRGQIGDFESEILKKNEQINQIKNEVGILEDEILKKNHHIDNLQIILYQSEQKKEELHQTNQELMIQLTENIWVRMLKSYKATFYIGRLIKSLYQDGVKVTGKRMIKKMGLSGQYKKEPLIIKEASVFTDHSTLSLSDLEEDKETDCRIAVHLHLFYEDLLPEFVSYLNCMPYRFDLFISCMERGNIPKINKSVKKIKNLNKVMIKAIENRGRDIAPLYVWFPEELMGYDYFLHIHSKKSLYTGCEKAAWRKMSLDSLLGSESLVRKIFGFMKKHQEIGLVYPEYYSDFCMFHCSWLTNNMIGREFLNRLHIEQEERIFQYPAGSFFWARTDAVRLLFELKIGIEEFPEEKGQNDTTLAHVLERAVSCVAQSQGYVGALVDLEDGVVRIRKSLKLFEDYLKITVSDAEKALRIYDTISFAIFGTLLSLRLYRKKDLFKYMEMRCSNIKKDIPEFYELRSLCEKEAVLHHGNKTTLQDIYECLGKRLHLTKDMISSLMNLEEQSLVDLCIPRVDMVNMWKQLKQHKKRLILIEDTYYSKSLIDRLLEKCGVEAYDELWLSNVKGKRKDTDEIWDDFFVQYPANVIHVGDDPRADWQTVYDRNQKTYWVMNAYDAFVLSDQYEEYSRKYDGSIESSLELGNLIYQKWFNSPFALGARKEQI